MASSEKSVTVPAADHVQLFVVAASSLSSSSSVYVASSSRRLQESTSSTRRFPGNNRIALRSDTPGGRDIPTFFSIHSATDAHKVYRASALYEVSQNLESVPRENDSPKSLHNGFHTSCHHTYCLLCGGEAGASCGTEGGTYFKGSRCTRAGSKNAASL